jgi:hypothetical protein
MDGVQYCDSQFNMCVEHKFDRFTAACVPHDVCAKAVLPPPPVQAVHSM